MPGNFELIIEDDEEVKRWLRAGEGHVNDWLYELVDAATFHAADRLRALAPGSIGVELIDVELPHEAEPGVIEGVAGVEPDLTQATFSRGLGSDPADFPYFVEVGTGVYGEFGTPIQTIPGTYPMAWESAGNLIFAWEVRGQKPQRYGERSFEETAGWLPARIELARREFQAEAAVT